MDMSLECNRKVAHSYFFAAQWLFIVWTLFGGCVLSELAPPLSNEDPKTLGFSGVVHPMKPLSELWGDANQAPHPTNQWWGNLVLNGPPWNFDRDSNDANPFEYTKLPDLPNAGEREVYPFPYQVKALKKGLLVSYTSKNFVDVDQYGNAHVINTFQGGDRSVLGLLSLEELLSKKVTKYDLFSVALKWAGNNGGYMTSPLVRGMAYVTMEYSGLTPVIDTIAALISVNDVPFPCTGGNNGECSVSGKKFKLRLRMDPNPENDFYWLLYAFPNDGRDLTFKFSASAYPGTTGHEYVMKATGQFNGVIRAAYLGDPSYESIFDSYAEVYPTGGDVSYNVNGNQASLSFSWEKAVVPLSQTRKQLIHMALPHHQDMITNKMLCLHMKTIRGQMVAVEGDTWEMQEVLTNIQWSANRTMDLNKIDEIRSALEIDSQNSVDIPDALTDPYGYGKELTRIGQLALIADEIGDVAKANLIRSKLKHYANKWLDNQNNPNPAVYDTTWGGLISSSGISACGNPPQCTAKYYQNDFGSGWYNDHMYHWGYHLYGYASLAKGDKEWLNSHKEKIMVLIRDIANPSSNDRFFPVTRNKDWFMGHSYASGLFAKSSGKDEESTSEAIHAYYAVYLFGLASDNTQLTNLGRLLMAMEIRSAKKYWHISCAEGTVYEEYELNKRKVVGILFDSKADYASFFGTAPEFMFGIQLVPITPISEEVLTAPWLAESLCESMTRIATKGSLPNCDCIANPTTPTCGSYITEQSGYCRAPQCNATCDCIAQTKIVMDNVEACGRDKNNCKGPLSCDIYQQWEGILYLAQAVLDKEAAWTGVKTITSNGFDRAQTLTSNLYWIATRPNYRRGTSCQPCTATPPPLASCSVSQMQTQKPRQGQPKENLVIPTIADNY